MPKAPDGVLDLAYARGREKKRALSYRLRRRADEVCRALERHGPGPIRDILDLGSAEGRMLKRLSERFPRARCVGLERGAELAALGRALFPELDILLGDAQNLPFPDASFDAVTAAAVIEHVPEPGAMVAEAARVLRPAGVVVLTSPHPFWERIATKLGLLADDQHTRLMNLGELSALAREAGLEVTEARRFMLSPVGMPLEMPIENLARAAGLQCLMANQLLAAQKPR
ncbi:MAG: class I SAM-dependent methyltransferase [Planctomycetota bacterium]